MEDMMLHSQFISELYCDTYGQVKSATTGIDHSHSLLEIAPGINCLNWIVGHIVVARCNFLMFLDVPSIWGLEQIRRFVPGSTPGLDLDDALPFAQLLADLDRSQEQLTTALVLATPATLTATIQDKSIAEHLAFYAAHEAFHTGQIELIRRLLDNR